MSALENSHLRTKVLLVEDSPLHAALFKEAIKSVNQLQLLAVAKDGEEAMHFLRRDHDSGKAERPDLVILDLQMPKMNGHEVLQEVRRDADLKDLPIVMMSTSNDQQDITDAYKFGADKFVSKPSGVPELTQTLESISRSLLNQTLASA